jgi:hypothetical protein
MPIIRWSEAHDDSTDTIVHTLDDVRRYVAEHTAAFVDRDYQLFGDGRGAHSVQVRACGTDEGGHSIEVEPCGECGALEARCVGLDVARTSWARLMSDNAE